MPTADPAKPSTPSVPRQRKTATVPSKSSGAEVVGKLAKVAWPDPDGTLIYYDSLVIGYSSRNRKHKLIYLEEESVEVCELGTGPRYRAWQPLTDVPSDPLVGAHLRFIDNETNNDESWFDFMRQHPNRRSAPFYVYVYARVEKPESDEVSGPVNLSESASQFYRIVHAPNDFITTVDLSCVDYEVEEKLKLWSKPEATPVNGAENETEKANEDDAEATPKDKPMKTEPTTDGVDEQENAPTVENVEGPGEGTTQEDAEAKGDDVVNGESGPADDAPAPAETNEAVGDAQGKTIDSSECDVNKADLGDNGDQGDKGDDDKSADQGNEEATPQRSRVRMTPTKSVDVIPDDENLPENMELKKAGAEAEADLNIAATANGKANALGTRDVQVDVDPGHEVMKEAEAEEDGDDVVKMKRPRPESLEEQEDEPSRKLRRSTDAVDVGSGVDDAQVREEAAKEAEEDAGADGGQDDAVHNVNGDATEKSNGVQNDEDKPSEANPTTQDPGEESLSGSGSSRRPRPIATDEDGANGIPEGEMAVGDDGDGGDDNLRENGQVGVKENLVTSRVGDYISVETESGSRRKAYVEAYLPTLGTHFVAFCDKRGGSMQVKLTEDNHEVLDAQQAAQLTRDQARSKVDAVPMPDIDDDPPQGMLDLGFDNQDEGNQDDANQDEDNQDDANQDPDVQGGDLGEEDDEDDDAGTIGRKRGSRRTERAGSESKQASSDGRRKSSRRSLKPELLSPSKAVTQGRRSRGSSITPSKGSSAVARRKSSSGSAKMRRAAPLKVLGKTARDEIVSRCVTIVWPNTKLVYVALVMGYSPESKQHMVLYMVDHCVEMLELKYREWQLLDRGKEPWNSDGMVGKRVFVWWPGEYNSADSQRRAERLFGDETQVKVAYEAYVLEYLGKGVYKIVYPCNEDCEERQLNIDKSDPESPLDKEWDILPEGVNDVMGLPVIGWEG